MPVCLDLYAYSYLFRCLCMYVCFRDLKCDFGVYCLEKFELL